MDSVPPFFLLLLFFSLHVHLYWLLYGKQCVLLGVVSGRGQGYLFKLRIIHWHEYWMGMRCTVWCCVACALGLFGYRVLSVLSGPDMYIYKGTLFLEFCFPVLF